MGDAIKPWLKLTKGAVEGANRMNQVQYERILAEQRVRAEADTEVRVKFIRPPPNPDNYPGEQEKEEQP